MVVHFVMITAQSDTCGPVKIRSGLLRPSRRPRALAGLPVVLFALIQVAGWGQVTLTKVAGEIRVDVNRKPFTTFFIGADAPKPYLHPLRSASGKIVTRRYPMETVPGESRSAPHQRGVWFAHRDVNGVDFWANEPGQKGRLGRIVLDRVLDVKSGTKTGSVVVRFRWLDDAGLPLLSDLRSMTFYAQPTLRTIDLGIELTAVRDVVLGDEKDAFFGLRLADTLAELGGSGTLVNAEGATTEKDVWGKRSSWVDYYGEIEGEKLGIAAFDHPSNPRYPTYWHVRAYGLLAANPFALKTFLSDPKQDGGVALKEGQKLQFRFRLIVHPGDYKSAVVAKLFEEYSNTKP